MWAQAIDLGGEEVFVMGGLEFQRWDDAIKVSTSM